MSIRFLFFFCCIPFFVWGQGNINNKLATGRYEKATLLEILTDLESKYPVRICVEPDQLPWYKLDFEFSDKTLYEAMTALLPRHGLHFAVLNDSMVGVCKRVNLNADYLRTLRQRCLDNNIEQPAFLKPHEMSVTLGKTPMATGKIQADMLVIDDANNEPIVGATVLLDGRNGIPPTNNKGELTLSLDTGKHTIIIRYFGYRETHVALQVWQSDRFTVPLKSTPQLLQEVQISGNKAENKLRNAQAAVEALPIQTIKELPSFMGEADVIKSLSVLPGVSSAGEGASGFNVRGGNVDQNLALQDNAPLFNTSHVLGLFSVFNPDVVQGVTLYKGHIPARFGGRIASVLDVRLRDGDFGRYHGNIGLGLVTGKATLEGPVWKNRVSFIGGYRRSYAQWFLNLLQVQGVRNSIARFDDAVLKVSARIGSRGSLSVSGFQSNDAFRYQKEFGYRWSNRVFNMTLKNPLSERLISILQANYGQYRGNYSVPQGLNAFDLDNGLNYQNATWRGVFSQSEQQEINFGLQWERIIAQPEVLRPGDRSLLTAATAAKDRGENVSVFIEDDIQLGKHWAVSGGLRGVYFRQFGPKKEYFYRENSPRTTENIIDSVSYATGKTIFSDMAIEPRISVKYQWQDHHALKLSYNRIRQFVHQISNLAAPTPVDIWQISTQYIAPQQSDNLNLGYTTDWASRNHELSADVFYRTTQNVPVFKNLPSLLLNEHIETELVAGQNTSYGLELSARRKAGQLSGWLTYTYARSLMQVPFSPLEEPINKSQVFSSDYDQPHQVNALVRYASTPSFYMVLNYVYRTGRPVTAPSSRYSVGNVVVPDYALRNNFRIPDYHRVDFSLNFDQNKSKISGVKTSFNISLYNVLFRKNPFSVFFQKRPGQPVSAYSLAMVGTMVPAANLVFTF
jgi:hypothetical protein